nr:hypothetical protein [Tanacetum cinerariifolium]
MGFLAGCHPYISLDACHLKGKFNGVLVAATGIDGNSSMFPVAYGILELKNTSSWIWFLKLLKKAIETPHGLVISSDMQKGLENISKNLGEYAVCRSSDNRAEVKHKGKRWEKFKEAYALEIAPLPTMNHWVPRESEEKIFPPVFKRPIERPRKNRIVAHDESKRKKRCPRCLKTGHHEKSCKNSAPSKGFKESEASTSKSGRKKSVAKKRKAW